ncbi:hypothetical protein ACWD62_40570 [Streptomyces sp. NPDC005146]
MARELATREHTDPFGRQVRLSRGTIDRWTCHYRGGGFAGSRVDPSLAGPPRGRAAAGAVTPPQAVCHSWRLGRVSRIGERVRGGSPPTCS